MTLEGQIVRGICLKQLRVLTKVFGFGASVSISIIHKKIHT